MRVAGRVEVSAALERGDLVYGANAGALESLEQFSANLVSRRTSSCASGERTVASGTGPAEQRSLAVVSPYASPYSGAARRVRPSRTQCRDGTNSGAYSTMPFFWR